MARSARSMSRSAPTRWAKLDAIFPGPGGPGSRPLRLVTRDRVYAVFAMMPLISSVSKARAHRLRPHVAERAELEQVSLKGTFSLTRRPDQRRCSIARPCCSLSSTCCSAA